MNKIRTIGIALFTLALIALSVGSADAQTTRFPNGVTNVATSDPLAHITVPSPCDMVVWFEDFNTSMSNPANTVLNVTKDWALTIASDGTGASSNITGGSWVIITDTVASGSGTVFGQVVNKSFSSAVGKKLYFEAKIRMATNGSASEIVVGLQPTDTSPVSGYGVYFQKGGYSSYFDGRNSCASGVEAVTSSIAVTNGAWYKLNFYFDGVSRTHFYVNDTYCGVAGLNRLPTTSALSPSIGIQNNNNVASTLVVDYIYVAQER